MKQYKPDHKLWLRMETGGCWIGLLGFLQGKYLHDLQAQLCPVVCSGNPALKLLSHHPPNKSPVGVLVSVTIVCQLLSHNAQ